MRAFFLLPVFENCISLKSLVPLKEDDAIGSLDVGDGIKQPLGIGQQGLL